MKIVKALKQFYQLHLEFPNEEKFDGDFQQLLQIFYFFGFYQPTPSKKRVIYGALTFTILVLTTILGPINNAVKAYYVGDMALVLASCLLISYMVSYAIQIALFSFNQKHIIGIIKEFHLMHEADGEKVIQKLGTKCMVMTKCYNLFLYVAGLSYVVFKFFGLNPYKLIIPAIYDEVAVGYFYYVLSCVNVAHIVCLMPILTACDLLHIICIVRIEAHLKLLCRKVRCCAEDNDLEKSERELVACMRYHVSIIA